MNARNRPGTAAYATGQATAAAILEAAKQQIIDKGTSQLSMRGIARDLGMSPGNLSYYYASKADLLEDLFNYVLAPYLEEFERLRELKAESSEAQLRAVLTFVFDDLGQKETTHFFPEMWSLSLRDSVAEEHMERMYSVYRSVLTEIIHSMRPELSDTTVEDLALTISASIEGHTVFIGHARPHSGRASNIKALLIEQLISMVGTACNSAGTVQTISKT